MNFHHLTSTCHSPAEERTSYKVKHSILQFRLSSSMHEPTFNSVTTLRFKIIKEVSHPFQILSSKRLKHRSYEKVAYLSHEFQRHLMTSFVWKMTTYSCISLALGSNFSSPKVLHTFAIFHFDIPYSSLRNRRCVEES